MQRPNRYLGVRPFETEDKDLFFGRDTDVGDLGDLIALERLVVLFGKSGYGKSSLLNAGIIPHLNILRDPDDGLLLPIMVRFGSYVENTSPTPIDNLLMRINEKTVVTEESQFLEDLLPEQPLWYQFKRRQTAEKRRFLLIFDQFEEFFTYPSSQQNAFKVQLAELLYQDTPQSIRKVSPTLSRDQRQFLSQIIEVKVLFAIRADRMSFLDSMKEKLPAILQVRYELKGLSEMQARQAIEQPAKREGSFLSPAFTYSPESLKVIIQRLSESKNSQRLGIEAFQLQILCEYLEGEVSAGRIPNKRIEPAHFANKIDDIFEGYYQRLLNKLPPQMGKVAQRLIEESLIFSDNKTGESRRLSVDADVLVQRYTTEGMTHDSLQELENTFLLRREANNMEGFSYEVSHDTLIPAIIRQKTRREAREARRRLNTKIIVFAFTIMIGAMFTKYVINLRQEAIYAKEEGLRKEAELQLAKVKLDKMQNPESEDVGARFEKIKTTTLKNLVTPHADILLVDKRPERDWYKFKLWIDVPALRKSEIKSVIYYFDHPSFAAHKLGKQRKGTNSESNFSYEYPGWGCLSTVQIWVTQNSGIIDTLYFNMCQDLDRKWSNPEN